MKLDIVDNFIGKILHPSKQNLSPIEYNKVGMSQYCNKAITLHKNCSSPCVCYVLFFTTVLINQDKKTEEMNQMRYILRKHFLEY